MSRIGKKFEGLKREGKKALIPYITPEYPIKGITLDLLRALEEAGADLVEVGIPFSDPLADGETIQHSSEHALKNGVTIHGILHAVAEFRKGSELPVILMGYLNPIVHFGIGKFLEACQASGVDGLIIPDMPPEESEEVVLGSRRLQISNVFLIAPTTPDKRIREIDASSTDFSYCVSVTGVTGARSQLGEARSLDEFLVRVQRNTTKPFVVGFGISRPEHVRRVWEYADGAVVGSSLINVLSNAGSMEEALRSAKEFIRSLRSS